MNTSFKLNKSAAAVLAATMLITGCATPGGQAGSASGGQSNECNPLLAAGIGAALGAIIGDSSRGTLIGAGLGALTCMAINYHTEQVKTAQQVQEEYKNANNGRLPAQTTLVRYDTQLNPGAVRPGEKAQSASYIEVVQGRNDPIPQVEEEMILHKPNGDKLKSVKKPVVASTSGGYKGGFSFALPEGVPQGVYPVKTALYLNGKKVGAKDTKLQVVSNGRGETSYVALAQ